MCEGARLAGAADVGRIFELATALHAEMQVLRGGDVWAVRDARRLDPAVYQALVGSDEHVAIVGTIDDVVVGYATADLERTRDGRRLGVVRELFVEPEAREVGVGEAMTNAMLEQLQAADCDGVDAFALPGHREAKNFFEGNGLTARLLVMHRRL